MLSFSLIVIIAGLIILIGIGIWTNQRRRLGSQPEVERDLVNRSSTSHSDNAVIVIREHGQLVYVNDQLRDWLNVYVESPSLEFVIQNAQPAENLRQLFADESRAVFRFGRRWVEGWSHYIPGDDELRLVVTLREFQAGEGAQGASGDLDIAAAMHIIDEIGETVTVSMGGDQTLQTLLNIIEKHVDIDSAEICIWDENNQVLRQRGWVGDASYVVALASEGGTYEMSEGITGWVARQRQPLLVADATAPDVIAPKLSDSGYHSFVATPLMLGDLFIGTLELAHRQRGRFGQGDVALLQSIARPVATAIHNANLYLSQAQRIDDIANLQGVTAGHDLSSGNVDEVYLALNRRIAELADTQMCGVLLYDERRNQLAAQLPFYGLPDQIAQLIAFSPEPDTPAADVWQRDYWLTNELQDNPTVESLGLTPIIGAVGLRNVAMLGMQIGQQRIGMVMAANRNDEDGFTTHDMQNLRILVNQAAIVVENIRLFQRERSHDAELVGLQEITHAVGALSSDDEEYVYSDINTRIAGLMNIQMCGVLLYDETRQALVAQPPFFGVADEAVQDYVVDLASNDIARELWEEEDYWYTNRAQVDALVYSAGLAEFAERLGVYKTMMASLTAGGQKIGVIQVSNKRNREDFTENDARLLLIFATQAAAILENARLVREVQRRADESERLRRIAERASNLVTLDEPLAPVLSEVAQIMGSQLVYLSVFSQEAGALVTPPRAIFGAELDEPIVYTVNSEAYQASVAVDRVPYLSNDLTSDNPRLPYTELAEKLGIQQLLTVPLTIGERSLGEMGAASPVSGAYTDDDMILLASIAAQLSSTIDRVRLFEAAGYNLDRRVHELDAISNISDVMNSIIELDAILDTICNETIRATGADGASVAVLRPVRGWNVESESEVRLQYRVGGLTTITHLADIEREALSDEDGVVLVEDYKHSDMESTQSEIASAVALRIDYADTPVGILHLYHKDAAHFDERSLSFLQTMASKASLGYANAVRYYDQVSQRSGLSQRVEQLNQIFEVGQMLQSSVDQNIILEAIAYSIVQSVGFDVVVVTMLDNKVGLLRREVQVGLPIDAFERSKSHTFPIDQIETLLREENRIAESYFFPVQDTIHMEPAALDTLSASFVGNRTLHDQGANAWRDGDMLLVPITGANSQLLGILSLDRPQDNQRPERSRIEILQIFAHQAATTIQNNRLYLSSVQSAEQEARLNELLGDVASTLDVEQIVESVAHNALRLVPFQRMTAALKLDDEAGGYQLIHVEVHPDDSLHLTREASNNLDNTALGRTVADNTDYVYTPDNDAPEYPDLTRWRRSGETLSLVLPLTSGGVTLGALHFGSSVETDMDLDEVRDVLERVSRLMAVSLQNARLFDQAVNLRQFNESVLESIQQGIVVLDRERNVISANQFMADEYGWDIQTARADLFTLSPALLEPLGDKLREVLDTAEPQQVLGDRAPLSDGSYVVRNFYMYPLVSQDVVSGAVLLVEDVTERARLEASVAERASQLAALTRASGKITSTLEREKVIDIALDVIGEIIDYDNTTLWRRDYNQMELVGVRGFNVPLTPTIRADIDNVTRMIYVVENQTAMTIDDLPRFLQSYAYTLPGDSDMGSWLGVPLVYQGYVTGLISVAKKEGNAFNAQAEQALTAFANQIAVALSNADLFRDTSARTERLSILNRVSLALVQSMDSETIVEIGLTEISNTIHSEKGRAIMFDPNLELGRVIVDAPRGDATPTRKITLQESKVFGYVLEHKQPLVYSHDSSKMPEELDEAIVTEIEQRGLKDYLLIPMIAPGHVLGAFEFETRSRDLVLGAETLETGLIIANQSAIAIQNANQLEEITSRTRELETLLEASQAATLTMDLPQVFRTVTDLFIRALEVDDCTVMILDNLENSLIVELDVNRRGDPERISPKGTRYDVDEYPARARALRNRDVVVVTVDDPLADAHELEELTAQGDRARMFVPLVVKDEAIGLIQVEITDPYRYISEQEQRLAQALGSQVASVIENARLSTETAAQMDELFIINDLSQAISANIDVDKMLEIVRDRVPGVTGSRQLYVALYDADTQAITFPLAVRDSETYRIPSRYLGTDEVSFIIRNRRPLLLGSDYFGADEVRSSLGLTNGEGDVKSYLGVPLVAGDEVLGVMAVRDEENTRVFGLNDQRILTTVGSQLGAALQNARLFERIQGFADELRNVVTERTEELQEERDRLDMLYQITAELALTLDMDRVLSRALQMMASAVKAHDGVIMLIDPMTDRLYNRASLSRPDEAAEKGSHPAEMLARWLIDNEHELLVDDLKEVDYWDDTVPGAEPWHSAMAVLLETNEDVQGVLVLLSEDVSAFSEPLLNLVIAAANQVASAINNADLYQLIRDQAERLGTLLRTEQEEAEKSNAILEGIADGVMLTDHQGQISLFNNAAEEMLGLPRDQVMGRTLSELINQYGESVAAWADPVIAWISSPDEMGGDGSPTDRLDIGDRVVSVNIAPVHIGAQPLGSVSVFRDVTRDVEVDKLKNKFVLNVTHEFNTPMTSIKGYVELMLMNEMVQGAERENLTVIKKNTDRLAALLRDLLTVAKIDAGETTLSVEPVDLADVVQVQLTNAQNRHYDKHHTVHLNVDDSLPRASLDRRKTLQILGNVIDNAFNYTPAGGTIEVGLRRDPNRDRSILISIQDNGLGIPESFKAVIWDRFSRNDDHALQTDTSGTGLGLPIVQELVRMQGGKVWFESEESVGTTFYVSLPIEFKRAATTTSTLKAVSGD
jgi:PAS domain S-box-containing protein